MRASWVIVAAVLFPVAGAAAAQAELVITKVGTKEFHRAGCDDLEGVKDVLALTEAQAKARGLKPHEDCDPANAPEGKPGASRSAAPVMVYTDSSRYYHKKECKKLDKEAKKVDLDEAGKKFWPCPDCKPPIRKRKVPG